ncbi:hypothetical protein PPIS_b0480 [Pseudoalteromonas piscicida]|uniref:Uncharacterized protein n=1 Tax=Pseudoalteromonas piscicida TaxID=43662 RepID=A0ABN5CJC8_PSEO7|nr:hypothetical protein PPIS_b0480 [Pseudoalteromonas piscicida]
MHSDRVWTNERVTDTIWSRLLLKHYFSAHTMGHQLEFMIFARES